MKVIAGRALENWSDERFAALAQRARLVLVDLGCGDGAFVYRLAGRRPDLLCIGVDPNAETPAAYARKALRKPARGGRANVLYAAADVDSIPAALDGCADLITVNFPWAGLLRRLLAGDPALARALRALAATPCGVQVLINADAAGPGGASLTQGEIEERVSPVLEAAGAARIEVAALPSEARVGSRWAGRLLRGSRRRAAVVRATFGPCPPEYAALLQEAAGEREREG